MAQSSFCCSPCQNPHNGKDKLAGRTPTKGSDYRTLAPATTRASTHIVSPVVTPLIASGFADSSVVRYLEDDLQRILSTVLDSRPSASVPPPVVTAAPYYKNP